MTDPRTTEAELDISQDVLFGIAQLALDGVDGIDPSTPAARMGEILSGRRAKGIRIERDGEAVRVSLTVRVDYGLRIPEVARRAQEAVREAIGSMTGLRVETVDVVVESVEISQEYSHGEEYDRG